MLKSKVDDILDYSMLESDSCVLNYQEFSVHELMADIEDLVSLQYDPKVINFKVYVSDVVPATVLHDKKRIKQILLNLIYNALKFTERGFVIVVID